MRAIKEAILVIYNDSQEPLAIVRRDEQSHKVVLYATKEMEIDDIERLINNGK